MCLRLASLLLGYVQSVLAPAGGGQEESPCLKAFLLAWGIRSLSSAHSSCLHAALGVVVMCETKKSTLYSFGAHTPDRRILGAMGSLGVQMGAQTAKITKITSKMIPGAPKVHPKRSTIQ